MKKFYNQINGKLNLICLIWGFQLFSIASCRSQGHDSPQWGEKYSRNMVSDETGLPETFNIETGKNVKWSVSIGTDGYATPVIANGKVLIGANNADQRDPRHEGDRGVLLCLNESDGSPKDVQVKAGDTFCLLYGRHPSVGSDVVFLSADDGNVVRLRGERTEYRNPERADMPGGDAQSVRFVFEAMKPGQATLTFRLMFRGDVKDTPVHKITVEPK